MITPTVGRVVWVQGYGSQPQAALITYVHSSTCVNVIAFTAEGIPVPRERLGLKQEGDGMQWAAPYAEWMPYQKGQAAKTEALEAQLRA